MPDDQRCFVRGNTIFCSEFIFERIKAQSVESDVSIVHTLDSMRVVSCESRDLDMIEAGVTKATNIIRLITR